MQMNSLAFHNWTCSPPFPSKATGRGACTLVPGPTPSMLVVWPAPPQPVLQKDHREAALQTPSPAPMNAYSSEGSSPDSLLERNGFEHSDRQRFRGFVR